MLKVYHVPENIKKAKIKRQRKDVGQGNEQYNSSMTENHRADGNTAD